MKIGSFTGSKTGASLPTTTAQRGTCALAVIARKVNFGSSSDAGAETRSILMSVLHTLNKRRGAQSLESAFKEILDEIAKNSDVDLIPLVLRNLPGTP